MKMYLHRNSALTQMPKSATRPNEELLAFLRSECAEKPSEDWLRTE